MGKKNNKRAAKQSTANNKKEKENPVSTLEAVEAMSSSDDGSVDKSSKAWNDKAEALKKMIGDGVFDKIVTENKADDDDDESIEEVVLGDDDDEDDDNDDDDDDDDKEEPQTKVNSKSEKVSSKDAQKKGNTKSKKVETKQLGNDDEENDDSGSQDHEKSENESEKEEEEEEEEGEEGNNESKDNIYHMNSKALKAKTEELLAEKKDFPWVETFDIIPTKPLPFGQADEETGLTIDVHDDLKREVAFYDVAMEAVEIARSKCKKIGVPFSRPDDFFAEMVKSDEHMARVKDRLIFENKKIEAVTQRKSNKEQKLRAKEAHSNKLAEKSKRRKDNMKAADDWASSGQKRGWTDRDGNMQTGPNKKRMAANKKYGHGGKSPRFKQNTQAEINDMSTFNPKGNFGGLGSKKKGGTGSNRQGKRARDASRSRQRS